MEDLCLALCNFVIVFDCLVVFVSNSGKKETALEKFDGNLQEILISQKAFFETLI